MVKPNNDFIRVKLGDSDAEIVIPPWASMREVLKAVDDWAAVPNNLGQATMMWKVLTALRGPDRPDGFVKNMTTAVIRRHALPKLTTRVGADIARHDAKVDLSQLDAEGKGWDLQPTHFKEHIRDAVRTLGVEKKELTPKEVVKEVEILLSRLKSTLLASDARKAEAVEVLLNEYIQAKGLA